ncbi:TetR family transcriptional regulator [Cellulomonas alba]|uniref:TetR family transcriptional regulator n=1 Tax=Cellulomonas alba TaxID=3053467 RepID=A0ABT7SG95_9CELL|nr:TetR family transcriptional regulator [Cellulomonas alba]MDM7855217.1 TetR family transcriptional regulator [Cellulomonas alba]
MARWQPGSQARLEREALELFVTRGYDQTTVAEIASRAGVTERTFYRYFADKREVLFAGGAVLEQELVAAIREAPEGTMPLDAVALGLDRLATGLFADRLEIAMRRATVVAAHPELQERELLKMAHLAAAAAGALRERGVAEPGASLAADSGVAVFRVAFAQWVAQRGATSLAELIRSGVRDLRALTAG